MPSLIQALFRDGTEFRAFTTLEMRESFLDPFDSLSMTIEPMRHQVDGYRKHLLPGEIVNIYVDSHIQLCATIQSVEQIVSATSGITFQVTAFTPTKLLTEADPEPALARTLSADRPLIELVDEATRPFNIGIRGSGHAFEALKAKSGKPLSGVPTPEVKFKDNQPEEGDSVYSMLNKHASRLGVVIRSSPIEPSVYLSVPHFDTQAVSTLRTYGDGTGPDGDYFFGDVRLSQTNEGQHSECVVYGAAKDEKAAVKTNLPKATTTTSEINARRPPFRATADFPYKPAIFTDQRATSNAIAKSVSKFFLGRAAREAFKLTGTVEGLVSRSGAPWTVDTIVRVYAPELGIDENMWVSERVMRHSKEGQSTSLTLIPPGNLVLGEYSATS